MIFKKGDKVKVFWNRDQSFRCGGDNRGVICRVDRSRMLIHMNNGDFIVHDTERWLDTHVEYMWYDGIKGS